MNDIKQNKVKCCGEHTLVFPAVNARPRIRPEWADVVAGVIVGLLLGLFVGVARGEEPTGPTQNQIEQTYALTWGLVAHRFGLAPRLRLGDFPVPSVELVDRETLCTRGNLPPDCRLWASQLGGVVLVREDIDWKDASQVTILAHEFVHFFQEMREGRYLMSNECSALHARESEAYQVQGEILAKLPGWGVNRVDTWLQDVEKILVRDEVACGHRSWQPYPPRSWGRP